MLCLWVVHSLTHDTLPLSRYTCMYISLLAVPVSLPRLLMTPFGEDDIPAHTATGSKAVSRRSLTENGSLPTLLNMTMTGTTPSLLG